MARRNSGEKDSNDLLLDTLCNTFGGIILITLLLALLTEQTRVQIVENIPDELLLARLEVSESRFDSAIELKDRLEDELSVVESDEFSTLRDSRDERHQRLQELRGQEAGLSRLLQQLRNQSDETAEERAERLARRLEAIRKDIELAEDSAQRMTEESSLLEDRLEELAIEVENEDKKRTKTLRLPRERAIGNSRMAPYIVRYGQVYPLFLPSADGKELNRESLRWEELGGTNTKAHPQRGKGWDVTNPEGRRRLTSNVTEILGRDDYAAIYVYPDSFAQFAAFKEIVLNAGRNYGLEIQPESQPLVWTTGKGYTPPPQ